MIRKMFAIVALMTLALAGCGGGSSSDDADTVANLDGVWKMSAPKAVEYSMTASVINDVIKISLDFPKESMRALYWQGTFPVPAVVENGTEITSARDDAALESSIFAAQRATKVFTYKDGGLHYEFTIMGMTTDITLEKQRP